MILIHSHMLINIMMRGKNMKMMLKIIMINMEL